MRNARSSVVEVSSRTVSRSHQNVMGDIHNADSYSGFGPQTRSPSKPHSASGLSFFRLTITPDQPSAYLPRSTAIALIAKPLATSGRSGSKPKTSQFGPLPLGFIRPMRTRRTATHRPSRPAQSFRRPTNCATSLARLGRPRVLRGRERSPALPTVCASMPPPFHYRCPNTVEQEVLGSVFSTGSPGACPCPINERPGARTSSLPSCCWW
jgi:hypothetical protein